jgi:CheY-like chemotaxis protein
MSSQTTILLAEDEANDVFLMQRAFHKAGMSAPLRVVTDGVEAISYLGGTGKFNDRIAHPIPSLMFLDLKLPRRTGFEVLTWLRGQPAPLRRLPVVVLTSSKESVDVDRAYDLGANSYLVKPVTFESLLQLVKAFEIYWLELSQKPDVIGEPKEA